MNINDHIQSIVSEIIDNVTANVAERIDSIIINTLNAKLSNFDYTSHIQTVAYNIIDKKAADYKIDSTKLEARITQTINSTLDEAKINSSKLMTELVNTKLAGMDFSKLMTDAISYTLSDKIQNLSFPNKSIKSSAIDFDDITISGDAIKGGIIKNFGSTGIEDKATQVALTILDTVTVVENNLVTKDLTVEGNLNVNGSISKSAPFYNNLLNDAVTSTLQNLNNNLFDGFSSIVFDKIKTQGLDLNKITLNGKEAIVDNSLGTHITLSNLQKVGTLKELQTDGETLLSQTLYTSNKRVGINTIEPSAALTIWDEEVEVTISKKSKDIAVIKAPRQQKLVLSSNSKDNIILDADGSAQIDILKIGGMKFSSSASPPNYISDKGHVVWNTNPNPGGPTGWICLGAANWANFGIID